ncbi:MAG: hypothetical protein RSE95_02800 [Malacoplasma sp.]
MTLNIRQHKDGDETKIIVSYGERKTDLIISENSDNWNSKGINTFLINLASSVPPEEKIELSFDEKIEDEDFKQIVMLFKTFANEYNSSINILN